MSNNNHQAGKGDKPRPVKKLVFDNNFDQINWKDQQERQPVVNKKGKKTYKY